MWYCCCCCCPRYMRYCKHTDRRAREKKIRNGDTEFDLFSTPNLLRFLFKKSSPITKAVRFVRFSTRARQLARRVCDGWNTNQNGQYIEIKKITQAHQTRKERIWKRPAHSTGTHLEAGVKYWITPHYNGPKLSRTCGERKDRHATTSTRSYIICS